MMEDENEDVRDKMTGGLNLEEFKEAMRKTIDKDLSGKFTEELFMKVDVNCRNQVDWDEYLTYMLLAKKNKEIMEQAARETPLPTHVTKLKSFHKNAIERICFISSSRRTIDYANGHYATMGKEGGVNIWSCDFDLISTHKLVPYQRKATRNLWLTGMETISNHNMLAMSTVEGDIFFVDIGVGKFDTIYILTGLQHPVLHIQYFCQAEESHMVLGDSGGNVIYFLFKFSPDGLFGILPDKEEATTKIRLIDVLNRKLPHVRAKIFRKLHSNWVKQVSYVADLNGFLSCSLANENSLVAVNTDKAHVFYKLNWPGGFTCFDYDTTQQVIATGGIDGAVRIWNIYTTKIPLMTLRSNHIPLTHLICCPLVEQVISLSKDKSVKVWNLREQVCLQEIPASELDSSSPSFSAIFFNSRRQQLVVAGQNILLLRRQRAMDESGDPDGVRLTEPLAHGDAAVVGALYNATFDLLVTGCSQSVISVWAVSTGRRVMQFGQVHTTVLSAQPISVPITSMRFDASGRRLITGGHNGQVKFWNFNNGECLRTVRTNERQPVTALALTKLHVLCTGTSGRVTVFVDDPSEHSVWQWQKEHHGPALTVDSREPSTLVTSGIDGQIILWNLQTGRVHRKLSAGRPDLNDSQAAKKASANITENQLQLSLDQRAQTLGTGADGFDTTVTSTQSAMKSVGNRKANSVAPKNLDNGSQNSANLTEAQPKESVFKTRTKTAEQVALSTKPVAIIKTLFLNARQNTSETAILLAACSRGFVHAWSLHYQGGLLNQFRAVGYNLPQVGLECMVTDQKNCYLATGDTAGYVKLWLLQNYFNEQCDKVDWSYYYNKFPFLSFSPHNRTPHEPIESHAPRLLTCFRGHLSAITSIDISVERALMVTVGVDRTVRVWTLCGRHVGTLGQKEVWSVTEPPQQVLARALTRRLPHDVRRVADSTSLKVWNGGRHPRWTAVCRALLARATRLRQEISEEEELERHLRRAASTVSDASIRVDTFEQQVTASDDSDAEEQQRRESVGKRRRGVAPILGRHFWNQCEYIPMSRLPHARFIRGQAMVYSLLNTAGVDDIQTFQIPDTLLPLCERHSDKHKAVKKQQLKR